METHFNEYDSQLIWQEQQTRYYEPAAGYRQQPTAPQRPQRQQPRVPEKMPKARALALAETLKRWLLTGSLVGFGTFAGLVAFHQVGSVDQQSTQTSSGTSSSTNSSSTSSQDSNHFFNQQGGNFGGTLDPSQGASNGSGTSSSPAVTGSNIS